MGRSSIGALKGGERINEHGIVVERQRNGDARYSINIMVDGRRIHRVVGRESEGVTREQAERLIESYRTKAREERLDLPSGRKLHRSFAEAGLEYLVQIEHHPKHGRNYARKCWHVRERLIPYFKDQRPDKLTDFTIAHYNHYRLAEGAAQATINRELSTLSHFLNRCVEWGWIKSKATIAKGVEAPKQIVILSQAEKDALLAGAVADQDPLTWLFTTIAINTGMRHNEVLRVRWEEIDWAQRRIYVGRAKAGQREQPITTGLSQVLEKEWRRLGKPTGWLFPTSGKLAKHPHRQGMAPQFRRAANRAKLDPAKVTPHVLRHTAITTLIKAGVDLPTVQKVSGHKTFAMVLRYTHLANDHVDRAMAHLNTAALDAVTPDLHMRADETDEDAP
ncbi:MAG: site-specific integrase [Allopontixanthobacter sediminis]